MANTLSIWRGAVEPHETTNAGIDGNRYLAWRGAVEPAVSGSTGVSAKITGSTLFSIDISITGRLQEQTINYLLKQDGNELLLQDGSFIENWIIRGGGLGGIFGGGIALQGTF